MRVVLLIFTNFCNVILNSSLCKLEHLTMSLLTDELEQTRSELSRVCSEQHELSLKHSETEIKLKTLTEYFENKEQNLHRSVSVYSGTSK